jgi:hypothetical protein
MNRQNAFLEYYFYFLLLFPATAPAADAGFCLYPWIQYLMVSVDKKGIQFFPATVFASAFVCFCYCAKSIIYEPI